MTTLYRVIWTNRQTGESSHGDNLWPTQEWAETIARRLTNQDFICTVEEVETDKPPTDISNLWWNK